MSIPSWTVYVLVVAILLALALCFYGLYVNRLFKKRRKEVAERQQAKLKEVEILNEEIEDFVEKQKDERDPLTKVEDGMK